MQGSVALPKVEGGKDAAITDDRTDLVEPLLTMLEIRTRGRRHIGQLWSVTR